VALVPLIMLGLMPVRAGSYLMGSLHREQGWHSLLELLYCPVVLCQEMSNLLVRLKMWTVVEESLKIMVCVG